MAKITKRAVDALQSMSGRDVFIWDSELRGFGVRVKPSGVRTFLIQYRNVEGRTRRLVLGQYGALTPENARDLAREKLAGVAKGEDPSPSDMLCVPACLSAKCATGIWRKPKPAGSSVAIVGRSRHRR
jgi:Arm DNA-binding domain